MYQPLADLLRPQTLDEVYGQEHILGKGAVLRRLIDSGNIPNMVFYGPSGTGKTTVANIIAKQAKKTLYYLNATTASLQDVKNVIGDVGTMMAPNGVLLYLDEIQYLNKKQQQSLLEFMENGKITKISNHSGGILGGMSDGSPIIVRAYVKPTPSIFRPQQTVNRSGENTELTIRGRHDPIIVPRAVVVMECMTAITVLDAMMMNMSAKLDSLVEFYR